MKFVRLIRTEIKKDGKGLEEQVNQVIQKEVSDTVKLIDIKFGSGSGFGTPTVLLIFEKPSTTSVNREDQK